MDIKNDTRISTDILIHKNIENNLPESSKVDSRTFSILLEDKVVAASYKMYWLLGILDEVCSGKGEIEFKRLISRMIAYAWYPILQFKLSYGRSDNLNKVINYISLKCNIPVNCDEKEFVDFLYNTDDETLCKMMKDLTLNVPYRLLSPFFTNQLRGMKDAAKNSIITDLSLQSSKCLYKIIKGDNDRIVLNHGWGEYLQENYKIIKLWIYYKLTVFIQKRNPNVPAIALKLEAPKTRDLSTATKLWNRVILKSGVSDIYTGKQFNEENYKQYGSLSIDHFIPWSFVLHDEMWNLVPTFKNINSKKNDCLLPFDKYAGRLCDIQYQVFSYMCSNKMNKSLEEYADILKIDNPYDFYKNNSREIFSIKLRQCISPLYQIAENQGFQVISKIF